MSTPWGDGKPDLFVEACAGLASVSRRLQGGPNARPPVSRMGNKWGYSRAILQTLGLRAGQGAGAYLWCEPDDGCRALLQAYCLPDVLTEAAAVLRSWKDEDPRALWDRLRKEGPIKGAKGREVARWALLGQWSFRRGEPSSGYNAGLLTDRAPTPTGGNGAYARTVGAEAGLLLGAVLGWPDVTVCADGRVVDPREVARWVAVAAWANLAEPSRVLTTAGYSGPGARVRVANPGSSGAISLPSMAARLSGHYPPTAIGSDARFPVPPIDLSRTVSYWDVPYQGTTGYAHDFPREEWLPLVRQWAEAGAWTVVSEAEPIEALVAEGWHVVEITGERVGQKRTFSKQKREFLTMSRAPVWTPPVQGGLFASQPQS